MSAERTTATHHEAGRAVAAVMRGGAELRSVSLGQIHGSGLTRTRNRRWDHGFIVWAGPWAEARYLWGTRAVDAEDEDRAILADYISARS